MLPSLLAVFATFLATLLLLLVSLSVPIIKSIDLFTLSISYGSGTLINSSINAVMMFGVWGYCHSSIEVSLFGTGTQTKPSCSTPKLGYQLDSATARALQLADLTNIVSKALTVPLVLHPIACVLAFLSFIVTLFALFRRRRHFETYGTERDGRSRFTSIITFAIILPAAILTTVVFIVDVVLVAIARNKLRDALDGSRSIQLTWDSGVWMTLVATLALWFALFATVCPCGSRLRYRKRTYY
ncbi:pali-domain-containing protein [Thelephora terrestris]|uniref:Pali-domain-containing protein n=1 Tax=Thelephora terrestris TaxID=56493 RepID=A0A9P6L2L4_9AGAM|nr:pali-domain-containing protein [Thelephora terrestris]